MIRAVDPLISLPATDVPRAVNFYTRTLGLAEVYGNEEVGFHIFRGAEGETLLGVHKAEQPPEEPRLDGAWIWLQVEEIDVQRQRLEREGVRFLGEKNFLGPGWDQAFVDSEGNVLRFYERLREVRRSVEIDAPPAEVFRALSDASAIESWFAMLDDVELEPRVGGRIAFIDPTFGRVTGRVTELRSPELIAFEFAENWPTSLTLTVAALPGGRSRVEVHQSGFEAISDRDFGIPGLLAGLEAALGRLAEIGEGRGEVGQSPRRRPVVAAVGPLSPGHHQATHLRHAGTRALASRADMA